MEGTLVWVEGGGYKGEVRGGEGTRVRAVGWSGGYMCEGMGVEGYTGGGTLKKKSRTHVIKLDIAPKSFPPGQYLLVSASNNMLYCLSL